ncbi:MAG: T9SS type A sorting domain-containing protein [Candidatus Latescibacteria bacterium]|nr:T9SS type A sorting domain-containing protein [Candidatus Latescibacterota bacterium]NIM21734.1 T9SS type A sorting domain-containing protein [Candidatus Latescibacterota bacterium]NIM65872.1 T9SS type A sorting domain-containing protein [Candidatus Latescibacterota bacterium]NIO02617.1 T9SS type A sorting domain-containing protein [Candidatus Latescibacterota bacterium]NIO29598.1 T9SS type A sorting domain-containing protein [Candidatus Latescibacterota bacterium]
MSRKFDLLVVLVLLCSVVCFSTAQAQWTADGVPIIKGTDMKDSQVMVSDGSGGAIIAWRDNRGTYTTIYTQRIDAMGNVLWVDSGVLAAIATVDHTYPQIISDGAGGAIVSWYQGTAPEFDIYAQRIDFNGNTLWGPTGVAICTATNFQAYALLVPDGAGGAILTWRDGRSLVDYDVYAQRIDTNGNVLWTPNGVAVCTTAGDQQGPMLVSDGANGAIITWYDPRSGANNIYAQRVDGNGNALWTPDGIVVAPSPFEQMAPIPVTDGSGGAIIAWRDSRSGIDIYARRINSLGDTLWAAGGVAICAASGSQYNLDVIPDGEGGAIMGWSDNRGVDRDIYAQSVDANGNVLWTTDGVAISTAFDDQYYARLTTDGSGGAIIIFDDYEDPDDSFIRGQHVDSLGNALWTAGGEAVTPSGIDSWPENPALVSDDAGGAIITWLDWRNWTSTNIYAQRIEGIFGKWGIPPPYLTSVEDVPGDQGGYASVNWLASPLDVYNVQTITHYSIWRAIKQISSTSPFVSDVALVDLSAIDKDFQGTAHRIDHTSAGGYYWEWIGNMNAYYFEGYSYTAPTLYDSIAGNPGMHYFQVVAHTADQFVFWVSNPDSGYSVDNLSPAAPLGFAGEYDPGLTILTLRWNANTEPDLSHYSVYRGEGSDFIPTDLNRIATSMDTTVTDLPYPPQQPYYLKLSAFDIHANESLFATLAPESVLVPTLLASFESAWRGMHVEISWIMSDVSEHVTFDVARKEEPNGQYQTIAPEITLDGYEARFEDASVARGKDYTYRVSAVENGEAMLLFETTVSIPALKLTLYQNFPNPFKPETMIKFDLPEAMNVELSVYDASGRKVATIVSERKETGAHTVPFRADGLASGVYFYKLKAGSKTFSRKMIMLR